MNHLNTPLRGDRKNPGLLRTRWAAVGAVVAVTLGAGGLGLVEAAVDSGERPVLVPIEPCRLVDTRAESAVGPRTTPIGEDETMVVDAHGVQGDCDIPAEAVALSLNVTAAEATEASNIRVFPTDGTPPTAASLNPFPGLPREFNAVTTDLNDDGQFSVYNRFGDVEIVIDVNGYYEDHNHDDRYVQQTALQWAVVDADGTLLRSSAGVTSSEAVAGDPVGDYAVVFENDISECAYQATVGTGDDTAPTPGIAHVSNLASNATNGVSVVTTDEAGAAADRAFHLTVTC